MVVLYITETVLVESDKYGVDIVQEMQELRMVMVSFTHELV